MHQQVSPPGAIGSSYDESCYLVHETLYGSVELAPRYSTHCKCRLFPSSDGAANGYIVSNLFPMVCSLLPFQRRMNSNLGLKYRQLGKQRCNWLYKWDTPDGGVLCSGCVSTTTWKLPICSSLTLTLCRLLIWSYMLLWPKPNVQTDCQQGGYLCYLLQAFDSH